MGRYEFGLGEGGNDDGAVGEGGSELDRIDGIDSSCGVDGGEAVAGVVADGVELSEVMKVHVDWVCGYGYWRPASGAGFDSGGYFGWR